MKRGILSIDDLRARSIIDPVTRCWHWQAAKTNGVPTMWTIDYDRQEKRTLSGARAVWMICHQEPLHDWLVYRSCVCTDCVNPVHLARARTKAEIGAHISRNGKRKGTHLEQRRAGVKRMWEASGVKVTSPEIVLSIRAADPGLSNAALGILHGISPQTVSRIRRGESHRHLLPEMVAA